MGDDATPERKKPGPKPGARMPQYRRDGVQVGRKLAGVLRANETRESRRQALETFRKGLSVEVQAWREGIEGDLGGRTALSVAEATLLDTASTKVAILKVVGAWLAEKPERLLDRKNAKTRQIVQDYLRASEALEKTLDRIGLKKRTVEATLSDYFALKAGDSAPQDAALVRPEGEPQVEASPVGEDLAPQAEQGIESVGKDAPASEAEPAQEPVLVAVPAEPKAQELPQAEPEPDNTLFRI